MDLNEAQKILNKAGYLIESTEDDIVTQIAKVIGNVYEIWKVQEVPVTANWLTKEYKIHTSGTSYWVEFRKGHGFEHRGSFYPWRVCIKHPTQLGFAVVAYNMSALKKYFKEAKEIQQNESYKHEITDDVMELAMELKEAKEILNNAGFLLEDTDTLQDRIDAANMETHLAKKRHDGPGYKKAIDDFADAYTKASDGSVAKKIANAKKFNAVNEDKKDIIEAFKAIKAMAGKGGWKFEEDSSPNDFFTVEELTDGTLESVINHNKGFYTLIINLRKTLNKFGDFAEILLVVSPQGNAEIRVITNDDNKKLFDVSEYKTAIKYANWIN